MVRTPCDDHGEDAQASAWGPSAWGKVILLGEHAVVYGHRAIAGAIHQGLRCKISECAVARLTVPAWKIDMAADEAPAVARAFRALLEKSARNPVHIEVEAGLPAGAGLGSSAALCVALARALRPEAKGQALLELANWGESCFHDNPSGIDVSLSAGGGIGSFTKSGGLRPIACNALPLVVGLSGVHRSTASMVAGVADRRAQNQSMNGILREISELATPGQEALLAGDFETLGKLMDDNHRLLQEIGVSIETLDAMVSIARGAGALGAKLTGGGGGGAMIALAPGAQETVARALRSAGFETFVTTLGIASAGDGS